MEKFLLFIGDDYYPDRWNNFRGAFDSLQEAWEQAKGGALTVGSRSADDMWYQIISTKSWDVVNQGGLSGFF